MKAKRKKTGRAEVKKKFRTQKGRDVKGQARKFKQDERND